MNNILKLLVFFSICSCSMLDHRDFAAQMDPRMEEEMWVPRRDFSVVPGDSGIDYRTMNDIRRRTPATAREREMNAYERSIQRELYNLEARQTEAEFAEYARIRNQLGTDSERIYYLSLAPHERRAYLSAKNIEQPQYYTIQETQAAVYSGEIVMGMNKQSVLESWGEPERKDYAGDPRYENERWAYHRQGRTQFIYFEGGLVGGWTEQ